MLKNWLLAFRLKTLVAAVIPILVATALAQLKKFSWTIDWVFCLLGAAVSIQIATNLFNDAIDFKKGADKTRIGPTRVTQSGLIGVKTVYTVAILFCFIAFLCGIPLVLRGGWPLVVVGLSSLFLAYGYTGGPFPLAYLGLGDLFVMIYFGLIAVSGSYFVLTQNWSWESLLLGFQVGALSTVLIAINNLRDSPEDKKSSKKTLAVLFGDKFVMFEILLLISASFLLMTYWILTYHNFWFSTYLVAVPLAIKVIKKVFTHRQKSELLSVLGQSAGLQVLFGISFLISSFL